MFACMGCEYPHYNSIYSIVRVQTFLKVRSASAQLFNSRRRKRGGGPFSGDGRIMIDWRKIFVPSFEKKSRFSVSIIGRLESYKI